MNRVFLTKRNAVIAVSMLTIQVCSVFCIGYGSALAALGY